MLSTLLLVGGIGDGLFVIFFFLALSIVICGVGLRTSQPGAFCMLAVCLSLFIILFMVMVPKEDGSVTPEHYDHSSGFRKGALGLLVVTGVVTLAIVVKQVLVHPIQGSRIRQV